jgi:hypothetical protein
MLVFGSWCLGFLKKYQGLRTKDQWSKQESTDPRLREDDGIKNKVEKNIKKS